MQPPNSHELMHNEIPADLSELVLPYVICWDPLVQFPILSDKLRVCPNTHCTGTLNFHVWASGTSKGKQPRILHDVHHTVLLVCAIYKCTENHHVVYSTDPRILQK